MTQANDRSALVRRFLAHTQEAARSHPPAAAPSAITQCPGVMDVMGGIGEDSGSLVLTAALAMSFMASAWQTSDAEVRVRMLTEGGEGPAHDCTLPLEMFKAAGEDAAQAVVQRCREGNAEWALPCYLALQKAVTESLFAPPTAGLLLLLQSDFPADADFGRLCVQAAASLDAFCKALNAEADQLRQSRIAAAAVERLTGQYTVRTAMTALFAAPRGSLLQLRFHPQVMCQPLELPPGVTIFGAGTRLARPTTRDRLIETRTCTEMGCRMIMDLQRGDGLRVEENLGCLSTITPSEYVERYRDRLPPKITGKAFNAKFGALRGINGELKPDDVYKVRSRAEHHIYENKRVHEFAASLVRARRNSSVDDLVHAGELMYASHWSHSQRCGIGGVEPDQLVSCIRERGPAAGLYGAKVTAGGAGGELVVLMRDSGQARVALADAVAKAESAGSRKIHTWEGLPGGVDHGQTAKAGESLKPATA